MAATGIRLAKLRGFLLIFCLLTQLLPVTSRAQGLPAYPSSNLHQWGAVTLFHGLPSNHVRAIAQDGEGILWFGTDSGLAKYDGRRIEKVAFAELAFGRVLALTGDAAGSLWVGTDNGAARLTQQRLVPIPETAGQTITAIATKDRRAALVSEQGVIFDCRMVGDEAVTTRRLTPEAHPALRSETAGRGLPLTSVAITADGLLCGSLGRGLLVVEGSAESPVVRELAARPRAFFIEALATDESDAAAQVWMGAQAAESDSGLFRSSAPTPGENSLRATKVGDNTGAVTALAFDAQGRLWAGTRGQGAFVFDGAAQTHHFTFANTAGGLRSNQIAAVCIDREGVAWFGTEKGVCRYDPRACRVEAVSQDGESNFIRALYQSADGFIWCGTNRGLFFRPQVGAAWREVKALADKTIYAIGEESGGRVFAGTATGLFVSDAPPRADSSALRFTEVHNGVTKDAAANSIRAVCRFREALYVANFGSGVEQVINLNRTTVFPAENAGAAKRQVVSLCNDDDRRLLIGTAGAGVFFFDGARVSTDSALDELRGKSIWSIARTADDSIWFATSKGLYVWRDGSLRAALGDTGGNAGGAAGSVASSNEAVDARAVFAAAERAVWCATADSGLLKVALDDRQTPDAAFIVSRFDTEQGLPSQKTFALLVAVNAGEAEASRRRTLLIGTTTGVVFYEPNPLPPILRTERVSGSRLYQAEEVRRGIALEYPQDSLLVDVTAISSRTFPEQFQYVFSLFDAASGRALSRRLSRESQVIVEDLPAGEYRLLAQAFTSDLIASEPLTIRFQIEKAPFPWASTALAILLLLALLAMWWGYHQNRRLAGAYDRLALTNRQLAETRSQLADETERERRRIARDLHDQTLADLRRLLLLTDQLPTTATGDAGKPASDNGAVSPAAFRGEIESVSAEIRRICEDLSPSVLENVGLAAALEWALANAVAHLPAARKFDYQIHCEEGIEERLKLSPVTQIHLYRIAQEVINNISRHAAASFVRLEARLETRLEVRLETKPDAKPTADGEFVLEIEDNGCGFDFTGASRQGRGIANIRSRASLIDAEVEWQPAPAGGTRFLLRKPATAAHPSPIT